MQLFLVAALVLLADQLTKFWVSNYLPPEGIPVIPGFFSIDLVHNPGAAFGILENQTLLFVVITLVVVAGIFYFRRAARGRFADFYLGLVLGGAVGNLIDRVRFGYVVDMFNFHFWPVFNVADSAIVAGMMLLAFVILKNDAFTGGEAGDGDNSTESGFPGDPS